jgi:hypothetical protein
MRKLGLLFAALATALVMSGCSMIPGLKSQTGVQACAAISDSMTTAMNNFSTALTKAASDPSAGAAALDTFVSDIAAARGKVTNTDVGAALDKATTATKKLSELLKKAGSDASSLDSEEFTKLTTDVQTALTDLATACTKI